MSPAIKPRLRVPNDTGSSAMCVFRVHFGNNVASTDREVTSNDVDVALPVNRVHDAVESMAFIAADRSG